MSGTKTSNRRMAQNRRDGTRPNNGVSSARSAVKGRIGCGCLLFVLVVCMIVAGALIHPFSLRLLGNRLYYQDKILPSDVVFVPRFVEDKNGEVYTDAFRQYWEGNGKSVWIEDDRVFGLAMKDIVIRMAQERGIKSAAVRSVELSGDDLAKAARLRGVFAKQGIRKVVLVVPEYASRRFHSIYGAEGSGAGDSIIFSIKSVNVPYFQADKWWRDDASRSMIMREVYRLAILNVDRFKFGNRGDPQKE
jgi:hypothetical protein